MADKLLREMNPDELGMEARRLLDIIAAEFESDLESIQCFDGRIVQRSIDVAQEHRRRNDRVPF